MQTRGVFRRPTFVRSRSRGRRFAAPTYTTGTRVGPVIAGIGAGDGWTDAANVASTTNFAYYTNVVYSEAVKDYGVYLTKDGGNSTGTSQAVGQNWTTAFDDQAFGGSANLWGTTLTAAEVKTSTFGLVVIAIDASEVSGESDPLVATNFDFSSLPSTATINGVIATISRRYNGANFEPNVRNVRLTVFYTESTGGTPVPRRTNPWQLHRRPADNRCYRRKRRTAAPTYATVGSPPVPRRRGQRWWLFRQAAQRLRPGRRVVPRRTVAAVVGEECRFPLAGVERTPFELPADEPAAADIDFGRAPFELPGVWCREDV